MVGVGAGATSLPCLVAMGIPDGVGEVGRVGVDAQRHRRVRRVCVLQVGLEVPEAAWGVTPHHTIIEMCRKMIKMQVC